MTQAENILPRRGFLRGLAAAPVALAAPAAFAAEPHPDAALLALEPEIERLIEVAAGSEEEYCRLEKEWIARRGAAPEWGRRPDETPASAQIRYYNEFREWKAGHPAIKAELGLDEAERRYHEADDAVLNALGPVEETPAHTLEGLIFKARMVQYDQSLAGVIVKDLLAMQEASPCASRPSRAPWN